MEHDIMVIGASAGGVRALRTLVAGLPHGLKASLFIVLHLPTSQPSALPQILSRAGPLPALHPAEGTRIEQGNIYALSLTNGVIGQGHRMKVIACSHSFSR